MNFRIRVTRPILIRSGSFQKTAIALMPKTDHGPAKAGDAEPWLGPAAVKEAALIVKVQSLLERSVQCWNEPLCDAGLGLL